MSTLVVVIGLLAALDTLRAQTWVVTGAPSTNWFSIAGSADGTILIAGAHQQGLGGPVFVSHDSGATWDPASLPSRRWTSVTSSADGSILAAAAGGSSGIVYVSYDSGFTWQPNQAVSYSSLDDVLLMSLAVSGDGTRFFAANWIWGENPQRFGFGQILASSDSGQTWAQTGAPAGAWSIVAASGDGTRVAAAGNTRTVGGLPMELWVSTNGGAAFRTAGGLGSSSFTSLVCSCDGTKMAAGTTNGVLLVSTNSGAIWRSIPAPGSPAECRVAGFSADGSRLVVVGSRLSPSNAPPSALVFFSDNLGASWVQAPVAGLAPPATNWTGIAVSADGCRLAGAVSAWSLLPTSPVLPHSPGGIFTLQSTPAPALAIAADAGNLILSWIVPSMSFVLQQSGNLAAPGWTDVPSQPALDFSTARYQVTLPAPSAPVFFRLVSR